MNNNNTNEDSSAKIEEYSEPALCTVCQSPLDASEITRDNSILARCKLLYKIIPNAIQITTRENEIVLYYKCDNCQRVVNLYLEDNPNLYISYIGQNNNLALCNLCHATICNVFLKNNMKYNISNFMN